MLFLNSADVIYLPIPNDMEVISLFSFFLYLIPELILQGANKNIEFLLKNYIVEVRRKKQRKTTRKT